MVYSAKELLNYKDEVEKAMMGQTPVYFFNDSILKAMMIQRCILGGGIEDYMPDSVRMYCGRGSLFLLSGKLKACNAKAEVDSRKLSGDEMSTWGAWDVWQELRSALMDFLSTGKQLELIVDSIDDIRSDTELCKIFNEYSKNVSIGYLPINIGLDHFTASLDSYRIENSDEEKTATCAFHDKANARIFYDSFNVIRRFSKYISL